MKESDLAEKLIKYLEKKGYVCYKEVSMRGKGGNARADCYFVKYENDKIVETIAVETKLSMNLTVLQQSYKWKNYANKIFVCVPTVGRKGMKQRKFSLEICKSMGIGVFQINDMVKESVSPPFNLKTSLPPLYEQQKDSIAGNDKSEFFTSFKNTVNEIDIFMKDKKEYDFSEMINEIKHHYKNATSAKSSLKKMIEQKVIKGYKLEKNGRKFILLKSS